MLRAALFLAILSMSIGCMTPWVRRSADAPVPPATERALNGGFVVQVEQGQSRSIADSVIDMALNAELEQFGRGAAQTVREKTKPQGFDIFDDPLRATRADVIHVNPTGVAAAATGYWKHPDGSSARPDLLMNFLTGTIYRENIVGAMRGGDDGTKYYAFTSIDVNDRFSVPCFPAPFITVRTLVLNDKSRPVLDTFTYGEGDASFIVPNRSQANLFKGLAQALGKLDDTPVTPLAY